MGTRIYKDDLESNQKSKSTFDVDVPFSIPKSSTCIVKVVKHESPKNSQDQEEVTYKAEDEHENDTNSNFDLNEQDDHQNDISDIEITNDGNLSDPGASKKQFLASPKLKRSCSNLETKRVVLKDKIVPNESFEDLQKLGDGFMSPVSVTSNCSADKVILRKCSSSQILPSKSRRLWWKLFLWSHRNLHEPIKGIQNKLLIINKQGGYSSDTEPNQRLERSNSKLKSKSKELVSFHQSSGFWPQNQWMAFPPGSPLARVDEWVQEIPAEPVFVIGNEEEESEITFPPSPENEKLPARNNHLPEEIAYANSVIQSLNSSSTVAYISSIGLKVIPVISAFSSLRSVNLSGNSIGI